MPKEYPVRKDTRLNECTPDHMESDFHAGIVSGSIHGSDNALKSTYNISGGPQAHRQSMMSRPGTSPVGGTKGGIGDRDSIRRSSANLDRNLELNKSAPSDLQ